MLGTYYKQSIAAFLLCSTGMPGVAHACDWALKKQTPADIRARARASFARADAVVDVEVTEPTGSGKNWKPGFVPIAYVRVIHSWKGNLSGTFVPIIYLTSCDIALERKGEKARLLLTGKSVFRAEQELNGGGNADGALFNRTIDAEVRHPRPRSYNTYPGEPLPAK